MKITNISQQVKLKHRFSIFIDGKYSFSLGQSDLRNGELKIGQELTEAELQEWKKRSDTSKLLDKTLRWLSLRARSAWELEDYLKRKKASEDQAEDVTAKIVGWDYINDAKFAESWVRSRRAIKPISKTKLRMELRQKRVETDVIDSVLAEDETTDQEALRDMIERKQRRYPDSQKFMAFLARQGFRYDDIKTVLAEMDES